MQATKRRRRWSRGRRFLALLCLAIAFAGIIYFLDGIPLRHGRAEWRSGEKAAAIRYLEHWSRLRLRSADYHQLLAVVYLSAGRRDHAASHLKALDGQWRELFPPIRKVEVARTLVTAGRYAEFLQYDATVHEWREGNEVALYRSAALLGVGRVAEAETIFSTLDAGSAGNSRYQTLKGALANWKSGVVPLVLDRSGRTIGSIHAAEHELTAVDPSFASIIDRSAGHLTFGSHLEDTGAGTILTTLDPDVQNAAVAALGSLRGSIVVLDTSTNEVLAIASSPGDGTLDDLALEQEYEPGSIVKVLTTLNAIDHHVDLTKVFPFDCEGYLLLGGKQFRDWAVHGNVPGLDDAMAESCNVAFGKIGMILGPDLLRPLMASAGFDSKVDLGLGAIPLGRTFGSTDAPYDVASYAIGLEHESVTALHVAMLASMVANHGVFMTPRLLRGRRSILGEVSGGPTSQSRTRIASPEAARVATEAMKAVVTSPEGTGRRALVDGLSIAMKTGTSGSANPAYDALILAFAPADAPKVAVGIIVEHAGPAEFAGAKVARDLFESMKDRFSH